jgi:DNA-binding transcriptional LysR family regulator
MTEGGRSAWHGIEVRHLAALQALAEETSFHGAARRLGYSQPAVSQQLAALERIVGQQLVNRPRVSQPLTLTDAGERLLVYAKAIQASLATAEAELGTPDKGGHLRIGTYQTVAARLLPHVVRELARNAPHIEVVLTDTPGDEKLIAALEQGDLDLAFVDLPARCERELQTEPLAVDDYVVVVPRDAPQASRGSSIPLAELRNLKLIGFKGSGSTQRVIAHLRTQGVEPQFVLRSDDNAVIQGYVAAGFGAALIPQLAAELLSGEFAVLTVEPALPPRVIALAWVRDLSAAPWAQLFVRTTRDVAARLWSDIATSKAAITNRRLSA